MTRTPCSQRSAQGRGVSFLVAAALAGTTAPLAAFAADGATEALELRLHAERAIAQERAAGQTGMAEAMQGMLPDLLLEYLASRDETIALDVVDAAAVRNDLATAKLIQDPSMAWALDVFAGPGTGHEHGLRNAMAQLADFQAAEAPPGLARASEAVVDAYERQLERADKHQEMQLEREQRKAEMALAKVTDRAAHLERLAEKKAEHAVAKAEKVAEKAAEKTEDKAEKQAEQAQKIVEKEADQAAKAAEPLVEEQPAQGPGKAEPGEKEGGKPAKK